MGNHFSRVKMKLLFLVAAVSAQFSVGDVVVSNWDLGMASVHWNYKGGMKNMVTDLFKDYGFPAEFVSLFDVDTCTDLSMLATVASWTDSTKSSFESQTTGSNNAYSFYAGIMSSATGTTITRDELIAIMEPFYTNLADNGVILGDLMTAIMDAHFDAAVLAAQQYLDATNTDTYLDSMELVSALKPVKAGIKQYNSGIGLQMAFTDSIANYAELVVPAIWYALNTYETGVDRHYSGAYAYEQIMGFMDNVVWNPIISMCNREAGPFGMLTMMSIYFHQVVASIHDVLDYSQEIEMWISMIVFGDPMYFGFNYSGFFQEYLFQYTDEFGPHGGLTSGRIEAELHIWAILIDPLISDLVYEQVKGPICGVEDPQTMPSTDM